MSDSNKATETETKFKISQLTLNTIILVFVLVVATRAYPIHQDTSNWPLIYLVAPFAITFVIVMFLNYSLLIINKISGQQKPISPIDEALQTTDNSNAIDLINKKAKAYIVLLVILVFCFVILFSGTDSSLDCTKISTKQGTCIYQENKFLGEIKTEFKFSEIDNFKINNEYYDWGDTVDFVVLHLKNGKLLRILPAGNSSVGKQQKEYISNFNKFLDDPEKKTFSSKEDLLFWSAIIIGPIAMVVFLLFLYVVFRPEKLSESKNDE